MQSPWNPYPLPPVPAPLARLEDLAYNLWWTWGREGADVFAALDPELWESVEHNPIRLLRQISRRRLESRAGNEGYLALLQRVLARFDAHMHRPGPGEPVGQSLVAYFSAEFGLHESLPVYSGGLGVLAGDVCKAASDRGQAFVGVGLLYPQGYFEQHVDELGHQEARYAKFNPADSPLYPCLAGGEPVVVGVDIAGRTAWAQVWCVAVGRTRVLLLDTDIPANPPAIREAGYALYGGGPEVRLRQEAVLGIGGVRAVLALGLRPGVWHLNEGHAALAPLEVARAHVAAGWTPAAALAAAAARTVFTTHTPVQAGHDNFDRELVLEYLAGYAGALGLNPDEFIALGQAPGDDSGRFGMTPLALRMSRGANGVSERHGTVSRRMWRGLWPEAASDAGVPIGHVTNGVHLGTWLAPELADLFRVIGVDPETAGGNELANAVERLPGQALWQLRGSLRASLVAGVRRRESARRKRLEWEAGAVGAAAGLLDPAALTVVWARRFATYKRANLVFTDLERLVHILTDRDRPVQLVFAGKAHPADGPGQSMLAEVHAFTHQAATAGRVVFVEGYDLALARLLVRGADVWLNTPAAPEEASGTSGQKAALNGVPHLSVADGWWVEGYAGDNGWVLGGEATGRDDAACADSLYQLLESEVVPQFYARDAYGVPPAWVERMRAAMQRALSHYTAERMLADYRHGAYAGVVAAARPEVPGQERF